MVNNSLVNNSSSNGEGHKTLPRRGHRVWFSLAIILVGAAGLRIHGIADSSFWLDEFCSVETSTGRGLMHVSLPRNAILADPPPLTTLAGGGPWWSIWTSMSLDNHPPLYFILLRFWRDAFGESDAAARGLSVVASLAAIVFVFDAVRTGWESDAAALWAAVLMAVAMPQIHFAQEVRGYALLSALAAAACAALVRCDRWGWNRRRGVALAGSVVAMMLTHYYAVAPLAAPIVYAMVRLRGRHRVQAIADIVFGVMLFAASWGSFLREQLGNVAANNAYQIEPAAGHAALTLSRAAVLPLRLLSETAATWTPWAYAAAIAYVLPLILLRRRPQALLWYLLFLLPVLLVVTLDLARHTEQTELIRYTVVAGPGLYVLIGGGLSGRWAKHLLPGAAAILCLLTLPGAYSQDVEWRQLAEAIPTLHPGTGDVVVYASADRDDWYAGAMYLGVSHYTRHPSGPIVLLTRPASSDLMKNLRRADTIWLIAGSADVPPDKLLPGTVVRQRVNFPDIGELYELGW
jgi:uncharacterized membrane protein